MNIIVSIIIPVFNKWELTRNCLVSLKKNTPREDVEVIVVDNGSQDETATLAKGFGRELFGKRFVYVPLPENINFGPACNLGAKIAKGKFLFFLNNDTILTENWLEPLLEVWSSDEDIGAVGPLLLYPDNTVQHLGVVANLHKKVFHLYSYFPREHEVVKKKRSFQVITGAALLIKKDLFWEINGFYPRYKNGFEDVDLCLSLKNKGKKILVEPNSVIYHLCSQTPNRYKYDLYNSKILSNRHINSLKEDSYLYYLEDGYDFELTRFLKILPNISKEKEKDWLNKKLEPCFYLEKIKEEPFWLKGYLKLMDFFLEKKDVDSFLLIADLALNFFPFEVVYEKFLEAFHNVKDKKIYLFIEKNKEMISQGEAEFRKGKYFQVAQNLLGRHEILDQKLQKWLEKYSCFQ
ncbi:MAG: Glycosyl transferase family 2 [Desulfonauticus sp. 38_4375]|nr:MAG: Glycosyl transferase family 2 [Desulfonauticus sp. 38_4375]